MINVILYFLLIIVFNNNKYVNSFCSNRALTWKEPRYYYHSTCFNKVIDDNYCSNHQEKNMIFRIFI